MKLLVVIFGLMATVVAEVDHRPPFWRDYHEEVGIPAARRIWLREQAIDFDGSRIVGGQASEAGSHPHLGGLIISLTQTKRSICGSSLVTNTRLLTAAHCWRHGNYLGRELTVVLGSRLLFSLGTRIVTSDVKMHHNYDMYTLHNDIAIIKIPHVTYNNLVQSIRMAFAYESYVGMWAVATGYGDRRDNSPITQNQAKYEVSLQVISNEVCKRVYGDDIMDINICVGTTPTASTCSGDSGGPLAIGNGAHRYLIGITSFGHSDSCERGHPVGFTRVSEYIDWIWQNR